MKNFFFHKDSLVLRLMLAFMLVAVPALLLASEVATRIVTQTFNATIETWLRETTDYVLAAIDEDEEEMEGVFTLLKEHLVKPDISLTPEQQTVMRNLGAEYLVVSDDGKEVLNLGRFASIDDAPLYPGGALRLVTTVDGRRILAIVMEKCFIVPGRGGRTVLFADSVTLEPYSSGSGAPSLSLRIFLLRQGVFEQVFSSIGDAFTVPDKVKAVLLNGAEDHFTPDRDWSDGKHDTHMFYQPVRDKDGQIRVLFVSSASMSGLEGYVTDSRMLFWSLFLGGLLLSGTLGYGLSRRIVRPIRELEAGVKVIASGRFGHEVAVPGRDELARLGQGFNMMSRELAVMQREKEASIKQERARMLGEIALGFAHEIRNPLVVIKTSAEVLHAKFSRETQDTKLLGFVVEEVERINRLISEFLGFAKPGILDSAGESLSHLAETAMALCRAKFDEHKVRCRLMRELEEDTVLCDAGQIQQVLLNLLLNAVDAMPGGGDLTLRVYGPEKGIVCLDIADTGVGISPEIASTVHLPFVSAKGDGLGLGLAKVYAIVEEHGGSVSFSSVPGEGTVFTVCLRNEHG